MSSSKKQFLKNIFDDTAYINHKSKSWSTSNLFIALGDIILKDFQMRSTTNVRNAVDNFYFLPRGDICLGCFACWNYCKCNLYYISHILVVIILSKFGENFE